MNVSLRTTAAVGAVLNPLLILAAYAVDSASGAVNNFAQILLLASPFLLLPLMQFLHTLYRQRQPLLSRLARGVGLLSLFVFATMPLLWLVGRLNADWERAISWGVSPLWLSIVLFSCWMMLVGTTGLRAGFGRIVAALALVTGFSIFATWLHGLLGVMGLLESGFANQFLNPATPFFAYTAMAGYILWLLFTAAWLLLPALPKQTALAT